MTCFVAVITFASKYPIRVESISLYNSITKLSPVRIAYLVKSVIIIISNYDLFCCCYYICLQISDQGWINMGEPANLLHLLYHPPHPPPFLKQIYLQVNLGTFFMKMLVFNVVESRNKRSIMQNLNSFKHDSVGVELLLMISCFCSFSW